MKGNILQRAADICKHKQMKNTGTRPELVQSLFSILGWNRLLPGTQTPRRKEGAAAESRHKVVVPEARRKGKGAGSLTGEGHEMGMLAPTVVSDCRARDALMESTPFESKPKT